MQKKQDTLGLVWYRNDLRVQDNTVLNEAIRNHQSVIACYCFDPRQYQTLAFGFKKTEAYRAQFLIETIKDLKANLKALHIELFVYLDTPETAIPQLVDAFKVSSIYAQNEWTSEETQVADELKTALPSVQFFEYYDQFLYHPVDIKMSTSEIPQVFTNF